MRKIFTIFALFFILQKNFAQNGEPFVPVGATWTYSYKNIWTSALDKFPKTICQKDTLIQGRICSKLIFEYRPCDPIGKTLFFSKDNDKVYLFNGGEFRLLYDYTKNKKGDSWKFAFSYPSGTQVKYDTVKFVIDSVGIHNYNGLSVLIQYVNLSRPHNGVYKTYATKFRLLKNIGSDRDVLPMIVTFPCDDVNGYLEELRCYKDVSNFIKFTNKDCEEKTTNNEEYKNENISIFPNPVQSELFIKLEGSNFEIGEINIFTQQGVRVLSQNILQSIDNQNIGLHNYPNGLYFWEIKFDKKRFKSGKVLIQH